MINTRKNLVGNMHICRGKVDFEVTGKETMQEWADKSSEEELRKLVKEIVRQLSKTENN